MSGSRILSGRKSVPSIDSLNVLYCPLVRELKCSKSKSFTMPLCSIFNARNSRSKIFHWSKVKKFEIPHFNHCLLELLCRKLI